MTHLAIDKHSKTRNQSMPIFVISTMRSGSTLLRYLLNTHRHICCSAESRFLEPFQDFLKRPDFNQLVLANSVSGDVIRELSKQFVVGLLSAEAKRVGKPRWADKSPNYYTVLPFLEHLFQADLFYVFLIRHPFDCVASLEEFLESATADHYDPEIAKVAATFGTDKVGCAKYWVHVNEIIWEFRARVRNRSQIIRYEDLVRTPITTMDRLVSKLSEDPSLLDLNSAFAKRTGGAQDHKFLRSDRIHTDSLERWGGWSHIEMQAVGDIVRKTASLYGYELP